MVNLVMISLHMFDEANSSYVVDRGSVICDDWNHIHSK